MSTTAPPETVLYPQILHPAYVPGVDRSWLLHLILTKIIYPKNATALTELIVENNKALTIKMSASVALCLWSGSSGKPLPPPPP